MRIPLALMAAVAAPSAALAANFPEAEPNSARTTAQAIGPMLAGDTISGASAGSTVTTSTSSVLFNGSSDWFRIRTAAAPLGIYRHTLRMTSQDNNTTVVARHNPTIQGLNSGGTDTMLQAAYVPDLTQPVSINAWYGFGRSEQILYRVTGSTLTTTYSSALLTDLVTPIEHGSVQPGPVTLSALSTELNGGANSTAIALFDSDFQRIGYADNAGIAPTPAAILTSLTPGVYLFATGLAVVDSATTNQRLDFPDGVATVMTVPGNTVSVTLSDAGSTATLTGASGPAELYWGSFVVVPAPGTALLPLIGLVATARRRRRAAL